jgi:subtilisin family serine protease
MANYSFPAQLKHSSGAPLVLERTRLLLVFSRPLSKPEFDAFLCGNDLAMEDLPENAVPGEVVNNTSTRFFVQARRPLTAERIEAIDKAAQQYGLDFVAPVYRLTSEQGERSLLSPLPNVLVIRFPTPSVIGSPSDTGNTSTNPITIINNALGQTVGSVVLPVLREVEEKSRYLNGYRYFQIVNVRDINAYQLIQRLEVLNLFIDVQYETMPLIRPTAATPNDTLFPQQWDMVRIGAAGAGTSGWDLTIGAATVVVAVLDEGVDLGHPDLRFAGVGINLGTMLPDGSPTGSHGTAVAGIIGAIFNNALGVAGVSGNSRILPIAFQNWTDVEVAIGITWAAQNGAQIINMSFGFNGWSHAIVDPAIQFAFTKNVVMVVATHNYNGAITYPATNPLVMAIGASDEVDNRKTPLSPDHETWGSNFGAQISVVAPGVHIPSTDRVGGAGYNITDYTLTFNGTSAATPHVAGMAALIRSLYPSLSNVQVRQLIEASAQKVGTVAYADVAGHPNGSWNQEMGYGRINVLRALDAANVLIKDAPSDTGLEPFTGANFWDFSDIVVRINDDNVFVPSDPLQSKNVERGQPNYIYVRVTNQGPREARNVTISTRITPFVGTQFVYPHDFTLVDGMHVAPAPIVASFTNIASGATVIAKFRIEAAQTETLYGWVAGASWHPCLVAVVQAENDFAFSTLPLTATPIVPRSNNLAQRNLSVINVIAGATAKFPFVSGNLQNAETTMTLTIDRSLLPADQPLLLALDEDRSAFPLIDQWTYQPPGTPGSDTGTTSMEGALVFLDKTRVQARLGCNDGVFTLEKGSRFDCLTTTKLGKVTVVGGDVILRGDQRFVEIKNSIVKITVEKAPNTLYPLSLQTTIPTNAVSGQQFQVGIAQQDAQSVTVGGAAIVYVVQ